MGMTGDTAPGRLWEGTRTSKRRPTARIINSAMPVVESTLISDNPMLVRA